jgi:hypothetical protein
MKVGRWKKKVCHKHSSLKQWLNKSERAFITPQHRIFQKKISKFFMAHFNILHNQWWGISAMLRALQRAYSNTRYKKYVCVCMCWQNPLKMRIFVKKKIDFGLRVLTLHSSLSLTHSLTHFFHIFFLTAHVLLSLQNLSFFHCFSLFDVKYMYFHIKVNLLQGNIFNTLSLVFVCGF